MAKLYYEVNYSECEKLETALKNYAGDAEKAVNNYLVETGNTKLKDKITSYIPVSVSGKTHAKNSKWYDIEPVNLGTIISTKSKFYYLYYVANMTGTSNPAKRKTGVGGIDFMSKGGDEALPIIQQDLLDILEDKLKEVLD